MMTMLVAFLTPAETLVAAATAAQSGVARDAGRSGNEDERFSLALDGLVRPSRHVQLALRASGILATMPIQEGQPVEAGQLIAELDSEPERATLGISKLKAESDHAIRAAEVTMGFRGKELARMRDLARTDSSSAWETLQAEVAFNLAQVQVEAARFEQELMKQEYKRDQALLSQRRLEAPFSGSVWRTIKQEGEAVEDLEPIAELVKLHPLWVELNVPAEHFGRIKVGQTATVTVGARSEPATVITVDPLVDIGSSTFRVKLELPNEDRSRVAGVLAHVRFGSAEEPSEPPDDKRR